jgi:hypothetical protein
MRVVLLLLICTVFSFAGYFQSKNDTIPPRYFYYSKQDSVYTVNHVHRDYADINNTCAWTANCPKGKYVKRNDYRPHEHKSGPRWRRSDRK